MMIPGVSAQLTSLFQFNGNILFCQKTPRRHFQQTHLCKKPDHNHNLGAPNHYYITKGEGGMYK